MSLDGQNEKISKLTVEEKKLLLAVAFQLVNVERRGN